MKRVLYITYYFPPSGGSGVQRGLKMVKYLPESGWEPLVLTVDPEKAAYPDLDPAMAADVPAETHVERTDSWDPYSMYARLMGRSKQDVVGVGFLGADHTSTKERFARWIRANVFLPDARVGWARFAVKAGRRLSESPGYDAIVTTGPPHSAHLVGYRLSRETGIPWVADLRDAWPDPAYQAMLPAGNWARRRDERLRNRALQHAHARVAVTKDLAAHMTDAVGAPFEVIRNGFDPDDMLDSDQNRLSTSQAVTELKNRFLLVHTGNLSPARDPEPLWNVLERDKNASRWPRLQVVFIGNVDPTILEQIGRRGLSERVTCIRYVPHAEAVSWMKTAAALLLPINRVMGSAGIVTGKVYEYLASTRPVIALGEPGGEADGLLSDSGGGRLYSYEDESGLAEELDRHYQAWEAGQPVIGATHDDLGPYSRRTQAAALAGILDDLNS